MDEKARVQKIYENLVRCWAHQNGYKITSLTLTKAKEGEKGGKITWHIN